MKVTIILCKDEPEIIWNSFRLANLMLENMDDVTIFLNGPSVTYESLDCDKFPIRKLAKIFTLSEGELLA